MGITSRRSSHILKLATIPNILYDRPHDGENIMPMNRKNKDSGSSNNSYNAQWFTKNVKRVRNRNKIAKQSRKKNR